MNSKIAKALNEQLNIEHAASYHYLEMSTLAEAMGLKGAAKWLRQQSYEEMEHMMKYYQFILDRDGDITLTGNAPSKYNFKTIKDIFKTALKSEQHVSKTTHALLELAQKEKDHPTVQFLQWFVKEQVEEEAKVQEILTQIDIIGTDGRSLYFLDKNLGKEAMTFHDYASHD